MAPAKAALGGTGNVLDFKTAEKLQIDKFITYMGYWG